MVSKIIHWMKGGNEADGKDGVEEKKEERITIKNTGFRKDYQRAKKHFKNHNWPWDPASSKGSN